MQGPKTLLECEDHWVTDLGAWFPGERVVFRGKDLFQELGDSSWMGLLLYGITGREFNRTREALKSKQKELKKQGKENLPCDDALTDDEINILFQKGFLGPQNPH